MRMRQLRYFEAVAEELHFGKAAERLHIQQPPLSRQIQSLEEELGTQLFNRNNRKVELTDAGKYFLGEAKEILKNDSRARTTLQAMGKGTAGKLHVSFVYLALSSAFPDIVGDFMKKFPQVDMVLHDETSLQQITNLIEGTRHVGFLTLNITDIQDLSHIIVQRTFSCAAIPASHDLAKKDVLTLQDLSTIPYICSREAYSQRRVEKVQKKFKEAGLKLKLGMQFQRKHTETIFVAAGMGWTFVDCGSEHIMPEGVVLKQIETESAPLEVAMVWSPDRVTPLVENFLTFYTEHVRV